MGMEMSDWEMKMDSRISSAIISIELVTRMMIVILWILVKGWNSNVRSGIRYLELHTLISNQPDQPKMFELYSNTATEGEVEDFNRTDTSGLPSDPRKLEVIIKRYAGKLTKLESQTRYREWADVEKYQPDLVERMLENRRKLNAAKGYRKAILHPEFNQHHPAND